MAGPLEVAVLDWPVPDIGTLCRRPSGLTVQTPCGSSTGALHLLVDSTGIKAAGEGERSARKHGASRPWRRRKVHLGVGAETMEVRAIEVTGSRVEDGPMLAKLLAQIPPGEPVGKVTADGAYDTRPCHAAIAARQASAVILTRRNGRSWKEIIPSARSEILNTTCRYGIDLASWNGHHRRSRDEAKIRRLKLRGERLMARIFDRQTTEFHTRVALINRFARLGTPETQRVA